MKKIYFSIAYVRTWINWKLGKFDNPSDEVKLRLKDWLNSISGHIPSFYRNLCEKIINEKTVESSDDRNGT